jgi:hypothetical protein
MKEVAAMTTELRRVKAERDQFEADFVQVTNEKKILVPEVHIRRSMFSRPCWSWHPYTSGAPCLVVPVGPGIRIHHVENI